MVSNQKSPTSGEGPAARPDIHTLSHKQLAEVIEELGEPAFRVKQIESWVWEKNAQSFGEMTNLSKALRAKLEERLSMGNAVELARQISADGSRKYLLQFPDGTTAECVGMPTKNRLAVCASTQAGCAIGSTWPGRPRRSPSNTTGVTTSTDRISGPTTSAAGKSWRRRAGGSSC